MVGRVSGPALEAEIDCGVFSGPHSLLMHNACTGGVTIKFHSLSGPVHSD
jgi:hypothetical protein